MEISEHLSFYFHRKQLPLIKHKSSPKLNHSVLFRWFCNLILERKIIKKLNGTELRPRKFMISLPKVFLSFTQKISRVRTRQHSHVFTLLTFVFSKLVLATRQLWGKRAKSSTHHTNLITWNIFFSWKILTDRKV